MKMSERTKFAVFVLAGLVVLMFAGLLTFRSTITAGDFCVRLFIGLGVTLMGVGLIRFLWDFLGDPVLERDIDRLGIARFWRERRDDREGYRRGRYLSLLTTSDQIDLMGLNLQTEVFGDPDVFNGLYQRLIAPRECAVRVIISDPVQGCMVTELRRREPHEQTANLFDGLLCQTLQSLTTMYNGLPNGVRRRLVVHASSYSVIYCMVIRIGKEMSVCNYLSSIVGGLTPAMHLTDGSLFTKYCDEFESAWGNSRLLGPGEIANYIQAGGAPGNR